MFVKMSSQDESDNEFVLEMTTPALADRANLVLKNMEEVFIREGIEVNELYENEELTDIIWPLMEKHRSLHDDAVSRMDVLVAEYNSVVSKLEVFERQNGSLPKSIRSKALTSFRGEKAALSTRIRKVRRVITREDDRMFEIMIIVFAQAMKQRKFVCSGREIHG